MSAFGALLERSEGAPEAPVAPSRRSLRATRKSSVRSTVFAVALALLGATIMSYPTAASWFSDLHQRDQLGGYAEEMAKTDPQVLADRLAAAHDYNASSVGGPLRDPFTNAVSGPLDDDALDYLGQVVGQPGDVMAELRIPAVSALLPVYQGTSDETLKRGIGHLYGSSLPVGGPSTHAVLTGHRGYPEATMFSNIDQLGVGDQFTLTTLGQTLTYRVTGTEVVEPDDTGSLAVVPGADLVTLITCTPTGINTHRLLVHAERDSGADGPTASEGEDTPLAFPWWGVILAAAVIGGAVIVVVRYRRR